MSTSIPAPSVLAKKKELNLFAKNWVRNAHVSEVADILKENTSLTFVGFRECRGISDQGAAAIASALLENSTLKKLNFESTKVGNKGVCALAHTLIESSRCSLYRLDLSYCPVGDEGVSALARVLLQDSYSLQILHLDYCPQVTDMGGGALKDSLDENLSSHMTTIGLKGTSVSATIRAKIDSILKLKGDSKSCRGIIKSSQSGAVAKSGGRPPLRPTQPATSITTNKKSPPQNDSIDQRAVIKAQCRSELGGRLDRGSLPLSREELQHIKSEIVRAKASAHRSRSLPPTLTNKCDESDKPKRLILPRLSR